MNHDDEPKPSRDIVARLGACRSAFEQVIACADVGTQQHDNLFSEAGQIEHKPLRPVLLALTVFLLVCGLAMGIGLSLMLNG